MRPTLPLQTYRDVLAALDQSRMLLTTAVERRPSLENEKDEDGAILDRLLDLGVRVAKQAERAEKAERKKVGKQKR